MNRIFRKICMGMMVTFSVAGLSQSLVMADEEIDIHKIGVVVYDTNDHEVQMFRDYYENYISASFPVEFYYSTSVSDWNDEQNFLNQAIEAGIEGFISFNPTNLPEAVKLCGNSEVYYMMGSGNIAQNTFDEVSDDPWFLGCIGPNDDTDYQTGEDMVIAYADSHDNPAARFLVTTGGSANGNHMHEMRAKGILSKLAEIYGYKYEKPIDEIVMSEEPCEIATGIEGVTLVICPGYDVPDKLQSSFDAYDVDAVLSVLASDSIVSLVTKTEKKNAHDIWVGVIDCFSQWNQELFQEEDAYGNSRLNYVSGKYASIIGPSFAAMFQALSSDPQMLRPDGKAFHLNQGFWSAENADEYNELFMYSQAIVVNAYSNTDLMGVIQSYNPEATFDDFKALTEAYTVEDAMNRIGM